ncbi:MAG: hypothetical protein WBW81_12150 [Methylocella sp.]
MIYLYTGAVYPFILIVRTKMFDYVPLRYIFDFAEALMVGGVVIHGVKGVWTALESGQAPQRAAQHGDGSD